MKIFIRIYHMHTDGHKEILMSANHRVIFFNINFYAYLLYAQFSFISFQFISAMKSKTYRLVDNGMTVCSG